VQLWRIAKRRLDTDRWLAGKVIIAVAGLSDETVTADDDVGLEGVSGAVDRIGDVARPFSGCWVVIRRSSTGERRGSRDENSSGELHCCWWLLLVVWWLCWYISIMITSSFPSLFQVERQYVTNVLEAGQTANVR
jgi:hypothetical protein